MNLLKTDKGVVNGSLYAEFGYKYIYNTHWVWCVIIVD